MKISLAWLRRWLPHLPDDGDAIGDALTALGIEVEGVSRLGLPQSNLVTGEVISFRQHPSADRLRICSIDVGKDEPLQIVCGAHNFFAGDRVPVALPGCTLPNGSSIGATALRGELSQGMLCSGDELQLEGGGNGILLLGESWPIGTPLHKVFPECDLIFDLSVGANRGDCMGHLGIARELAAHFSLALSDDVYDPDGVQFPTDGADNFLLDDLRLESPNCHRLLAWSVHGVQNGPSPQWLRRDLAKIGMRSISNVVDVTNWMLADCGQPLHAFDSDKIRGKVLRIGQAVNGESFLALNHRKYVLSSDMLVLCDSERPLVIAGTMGSVDGEVDESTRNVVLECALFDGASIQMTSKKLGLVSDSSQRFARGTDGDAMDYCARKAVKMLVEICGGRACARPQAVEGPKWSGRKSFPIGLSADFVRKKFGLSVSDDAIESALKRLHFKLQRNDGGWSVAVPPFRRRDVREPIDLVEEFVRFHGLGELAGGAPNFDAVDRRDGGAHKFSLAAAAHMVANGYDECYNYSTVSEPTAALAEECAELLALANPLSAEQSHLRPSLLPGLAETLAHNVRNGNRRGKFFEVGRLWTSWEGKLCESVAVAWICLGEPLEDDWYRPAAPDFYGMKALGTQLAAIAAIAPKDCNFSGIGKSKIWQDGYGAACAELDRDGYDIHAGLLSARWLEGLGVSVQTYGGELRILPSELCRQAPPVHFAQFTNFPPATRDVSVSVESSTAAEEVRLVAEHLLGSACGTAAALRDVRIFDVYDQRADGCESKSIALRLTFGRNDRTLSEEEIADIFGATVVGLESKYAVRKQIFESQTPSDCL
ncbi:MAG: phenylalanine--tRNA ligase subunit beta [Puniceicoccales bacterium]|nr:phenylalanine--tRNA ligase subunit beta [Puniceicoccales bacterium]